MMIVVVGVVAPEVWLMIDVCRRDKWVCNFMMTADFPSSGNWVWVLGLVYIDDASGISCFLMYRYQYDKQGIFETEKQAHLVW